jgi:large subunit ribosomal protein L4
LTIENNNIYLSSRNLQRSKITTASRLTTYEVLDAQALVFTEGAVEALNKIFENK